MRDTMPDGHRRLDPKVKTMWRVSALVWLVPVLMIGAVATIVALIEGLPWLVAAAVVGVVVFTVAVMAGPAVRYSRWSWSVSDEGLDLAHGVLLHSRSAIPSFRVQQVDITQGPLERAFGLATLRISTASAASDGVVPGVPAHQADAVRRLILHRVAVDDGV